MGKFCNDISLETNHTESLRKIKTFLKPKGQRDYPALRLDAKTAKTNADKAQLFSESVERHFGIQSDNFDSKHFDEVNQFIEDNYVYFYPSEDPDDYRADMDDDHDLVADIDSDTLIRIVKFLKRGKAPGPDNIHNDLIKHCLLPIGQALFIRSCHEDVIFSRKSHNCAGTTFVQGDSVGGSKLTEQTLKSIH